MTRNEAIAVKALTFLALYALMRWNIIQNVSLNVNAQELIRLPEYDPPAQPETQVEQETNQNANDGEVNNA